MRRWVRRNKLATAVIVVLAVLAIPTEETDQAGTNAPDQVSVTPASTLTWTPPSQTPTSPPTEAPTSAPAATPFPHPTSSSSAWTVVSIVDGDTIDVASDNAHERVRIVGMDTPERGQCGYSEASQALADLIAGQQVELVEGAQDDRDRYGRLLRYVDVGTTDAGLTLIEQGLAIARYDSRDGYGAHPREDAYVTADQRTTNYDCNNPQVAAEAQRDQGVSYASCSQARAAGAAPVHRDDPGYASHLDGDNDGVGCE